MEGIARTNYFKLLIFILSFLLLWARREDLLMNAQFWAEDSVFWYRDAYQNGFLNSLLTPRNGYFQTVSTLIVGGTTFLNPEHAPFVANFFGLLIRAILVWFLFTERCDFLNNTSRFFISVYFFCMPGVQEVHANITNAHWYLSLYVTMILISSDAKTRSWKAHDIFFIILSGLSGPFIIFVLASSVFKYFSQNNSSISLISFVKFYTAPTNLVMILCSAIQILTILLTFEGTRSSAPLGFSFDVISSIISSNVFLFTFFPWDISSIGWGNKLLSYFITIIFISSVIYSMLKGNWQVRVFIALPLLIFIFSMAKPQLTDSMPQLPTLVNGEGQRYFVNLHIAIFSMLTVLIFNNSIRSKIKIYFLVLFYTLSATMFFLNFFVAPLPDMKWKDGARMINEANPGDTVSFRVVPPRLIFEITKK